MSSLQSTVSSNANPKFDEHQWIISIRRRLEEELENETEIPVCIFNVPKSLMTSDPDSYTPQEVAIGPYHYWRPDLYEMERYKLSSAKRIQKQLQCLKFEHIVDHLTMLEPKIRACYHKCLEFSNETLAWRMAIDASFLLEFLQIYAIKEGMKITTVSSRMSNLVSYAGRKSSRTAILRDVVMLENQIPLFVLRKILEIQFSSLELADEILLSMLVGFAKELSPFKVLTQDIQEIHVPRCAHLLDYLYQVIVPKLEASDITKDDDGKDQNGTTQEEMAEELSGNSSCMKDHCSKIWSLISKLNKELVHVLKRLLSARPVKVLLKLPWIIISNLPLVSVLKQPVQYLFFPQEEEEINVENENEANKPPLVEEITIPCVTELSKSGVRFLPTTGNIPSISFDVNTITLYLPTIGLDVNTQVVLRNLVAYEASSALGALVLTRYTELMNGIIDTEADVKLLRERGVIFNRLKSDGEAADMWNGMSKSISLTKVPFLDKVIEDVKKHYNSRFKVKVEGFMKQHVFGSWQFLTLLATIFLLLLMTLQAFCSVYRYTHLLRISNTT